MSAHRVLGFRILSCAVVAAGLAPGLVRAEVGVATKPGSAQPVVVYQMETTEDPTPVSGIWRKFAITIEPTRAALNADGDTNGDGHPSLAFDSGSGLVVAAWARNSAAGFDVVVSRFTAGVWTTPQIVAGSTANELDPQLVLDPSGSIHLFYWVDGATPQVFHTSAPADLSSWTTPILVSQPGQSACRPAGAFFGDVLRVAYEVHDFGETSAPRAVVLARLENGAFTPEVVAMTNNLGDVRPQVHAHSGRLWVDWVDAEATDGSGEVAWTRLNALGQWDTIRYEPFLDRAEKDYLVRGGTKLKAIQ